MGFRNAFLRQQKGVGIVIYTLQVCSYTGDDIMAIKRRLIVHGNVQAVGYRAFVKMIARNMKIKGSVKNLDDGTVEIYCECPDEKIYGQFKAMIFRKAQDLGDPLQMNVTAIDEYDESWDGFDSQRLRFPFDVIYDGIDMSPMEKEALERSEMAILAMTSMNMNLSSKIDAMHKDLSEKQDKMLEKQDETIEILRGMDSKLDNMDGKLESIDKKLDNMDSRLESVDSKLDSIDSKLDEKLERVDRSVLELSSTVDEKFNWLADRYGEFGRTMQELRNDMRDIKNDIHEMKDAFVKLAEFITEKRS